MLTSMTTLWKFVLVVDKSRIVDRRVWQRGQTISYYDGEVLTHALVQASRVVLIEHIGKESSIIWIQVS